MAALSPHPAYFVGGCVRNALLGVPVSDIDISTLLRPEMVIEMAKAAGLRAVPTGIDHGTVTIVSGGIAHEVTTFRADIETDGRRAVVRFSDNIAEDAARRDFTMNALYADASGLVIDPLSGMPDLQARRVRFILDAETRIREDYLRSLRFFRFTAIYGDPALGFDPETLAAIAANLDGLETLSRERIGAEMLKLLGAPDPAPSVATMQQTGVLNALLPGTNADPLVPLVHLEQMHGLAPDPMRRLAALGGPAPDLRLSKARQRHLAQLLDAVGSGKSAAALGYHLGASQACDVLLLRAVLLDRPLDPVAVETAQMASRKTCPVTASDLMPTFKGAALGDKLREAEARWIASGFTLSRDDLV